MQDQKLDNLLNLAMEATEEERSKSQNLDTGYDKETNQWEVIVKYNGDVSGIEGEGITVVPLLGNFALVTLSQTQLEEYSRRVQVEFIEKPKRLYFAVAAGKLASCVLEVQRGMGKVLNLTGKGVLLGIVAIILRSIAINGSLVVFYVLRKSNTQKVCLIIQRKIIKIKKVFSQV